MTIAELDARITMLRQEIEKKLAELNQIEGAMADCQYWREKIMTVERLTKETGESNG
jgi:prefoldin subunit 5